VVVIQDSPTVPVVFTKLQESAKTVLHLTIAELTLKPDLVPQVINATTQSVTLVKTVCPTLQEQSAPQVLIATVMTLSQLIAHGKLCQSWSELSRSQIAQIANLDTFVSLETVQHTIALSVIIAHQVEIMVFTTKRCLNALVEPLTLF